jgi:hypothetical protein
MSLVSGNALRRRRQKLRTSAPRVGEIAPMQTASGRCPIVLVDGVFRRQIQRTSVIVFATDRSTQQLERRLILGRARRQANHRRDL